MLAPQRSCALQMRQGAAQRPRTTLTRAVAGGSGGTTERRPAQQQKEMGGLERAGAAVASCLLSASLLLPGAALARLQPVNRPDLLPAEFTTVIDVAGYLTPSEERRIAAEVAALEADTGFKLRVLAQSYPETPGLAVRDYWSVDDNTIVFVADPTFANIINVNVGQGVDLEVPQSFWSRLAGKYGNKFFWQEKGEAASITNAVSAIDTCLREPPGRSKCATVQGEFGEEASSGRFGRLFGQ